jgi:hypothetical protein
MWHTNAGVEVVLMLHVVVLQQFSALTEVLFHFLIEPKEVKYFVIRRIP